MSRRVWPRVALGEFMTLDRYPVKVEPATEYPNVGIYSFGRGLFEKPAIDGSVTSAGTLFRIRSGQFIYSRLFAFEGAFALVPTDFDGYFVSNEYPTFSIDSQSALPEFVGSALTRPAAWAEMAAMTVGMGHRRQRLQPQAFLEQEISLPSLDEQREVVTSLRRLEAGLHAARHLAESAMAYFSSLREELLVEDGAWRSESGWTTRHLHEVADVNLGFTKGRRLTGETRKLPYLRAVNVQDGFIALEDVGEIEACEADLSRYALAADDILLLEGSGNPRLVGRGWIWDAAITPCLHQNSTLRVRINEPERLLPRFVAHAIAATPARRHCFDAMEQMSVAHLGLAGARALPIPVPPAETQQRILRALDCARSVLVTATRKVESYERVRLHLTDALVTGVIGTDTRVGGRQLVGTP